MYISEKYIGEELSFNCIESMILAIEDLDINNNIRQEMINNIDNMIELSESSESSGLSKLKSYIASFSSRSSSNRSERSSSSTERRPRSIIGKLKRDYKDTKKRLNDVADMAEKASKNANKSMKATRILSVLASIALGLAIGSMIVTYYRKRLHGECWQLRGDRLTTCKIKVMHDTITQLEKQKELCDKTSNPDKCKSNISEAISKYEYKKDNLLTSDDMKKLARKI